MVTTCIPSGVTLPSLASPLIFLAPFKHLMSQNKNETSSFFLAPYYSLFGAPGAFCTLNIFCVDQTLSWPIYCTFSYLIRRFFVKEQYTRGNTPPLHLDSIVGRILVDYVNNGTHRRSSQIVHTRYTIVTCIWPLNAECASESYYIVAKAILYFINI